MANIGCSPSPEYPPEPMSNHARIIKDTSGRRVSRISQACDRCRIKKVKCNGALPSCSNCSKIGYLCKTSDKLTRRSFPKGYTENLEKDIVALQNENLKLMTYIKENIQKNPSSSSDTVSKPFSLVSNSTDISKSLHMYRVVDNIALGSEWYTKSLQELLTHSFPSVFRSKTDSTGVEQKIPSFSSSSSSYCSSHLNSLQEATNSIDSKLEYLFSSNLQSKNNFKIVQLLITTYLNSLSSSKSNDTSTNVKPDNMSQKNFTIIKNNQEIPEVTLPIIINPEKFLPLTANFKQSDSVNASLSYFDGSDHDSFASNHYLMLLKKEPLLFKIQLLLILYITNINYSVILNNDVPSSSPEKSSYSTSFFKLNYDFDYLSSIIFDASLPTLKWSNNVSYLQCLLLYLQIALSRSEASFFEFSKESDYSNSNVETLIKCTKITSLIYSIFLQSSLVCPAKLFAISSMKNSNNNIDKQMSKKKGQKRLKKPTEIDEISDQTNKIPKFGLLSDVQIDDLTYIDMLNLYWSYFILCSTFQLRFGSRMSLASSLIPFLHYHYTTNYSFVKKEKKELESANDNDAMDYFLDNQTDTFISYLTTSHLKIPKDTLLSTPLLRLIDLFDIVNLFDIFKDRSLSKRISSLQMTKSSYSPNDHYSVSDNEQIFKKEAENLSCLSETLNSYWYKKKIESSDDNPAILLLYFQLQILISFRINNLMSKLNKLQKIDLVPLYKGYLFYLVQLDLINNKSIHNNDATTHLSYSCTDQQQSTHNINSKTRRHSTVEGISYNSSEYNEPEFKRTINKNCDKVRKSNYFYSVRSIENEFILNVLTKNKSQEFKKKLSTMFSSHSSQIFGDLISTASILKNINMVQLFKCLNSIIGSSTSSTSSSFKVGFVKLPILAEVPEFTFLAIKALIDEETADTDKQSIAKDSCKAKDENFLLIITSIMSLFKNYKLFMKTHSNNDKISSETYLMEMFKVIESYFKVAVPETSAVLNENDCDVDIKAPISLLNNSDLSVDASLIRKTNRSRSINEIETPFSSGSRISDEKELSKELSKQANLYLFDTFSSYRSKDVSDTFSKDTFGLSLDGVSKTPVSKTFFHGFTDDFSMKRSASVSVPPHSSDIIPDQLNTETSHSNHLFDQIYTFNDAYNHNGNDIESDGNGAAAYYMQQKRCSSPFSSNIVSKEYSIENIDNISRNQGKRSSLFSWRKGKIKTDNHSPESRKENKDNNVNKRSEYDDNDIQELSAGSNFKKLKTDSKDLESNRVSAVPHANVADSLKDLVKFEHVEFADLVRRSDEKKNENPQYEVKLGLETDPHTNYQLSEIKKKFNDFNLILQ